MSIHQNLGTVALPVLLGRLDSELADCESLLERLERACEALLHPGSATRPPGMDIAEVQAIDLLVQTLGDIRSCLQQVAASPPLVTVPPVAVDLLLRGIKLGNVRERLAGRSAARSSVATFDLF